MFLIGCLSVVVIVVGLCVYVLDSEFKNRFPDR